MSNPIAVPGTVVPSGSLTTPGGAQGVQGIQGPTAVSADSGNLATLGSDNLISVPQSSLWSMRMRSFNAIGNPTFEVDQRNCGNVVSRPAGSAGGLACDRWTVGKNAATATFSTGQYAGGSGQVWPGTNYRVSQNTLAVNLLTAQATLAAGEYIQILQQVEGPQLRELIWDVHSMSLLVLCTQPITFTVALVSSGATYTLTKLCQISTANQWTLITLPNLPIWTSNATWTLTPGNVGYYLRIGLGAGSTYTSPANDTWQAGTFMCGPGSTNFASLPVNSQFVVGFVQHEPGSICTGPIDCPFTRNYDECQRYFAKSYLYTTVPGTPASGGGMQSQTVTSATTFSSGTTTFPKRMAKTPTVTIYNDSTGVAGSLRDFGGTTHTSASANGIGETGFYSVGFTPATAAAIGIQFHYAADTGW